MAKETLRQSAAEGRYLHRDFHNIMSLGLDYLLCEYGVAGVEEYLSGFAERFYAPLIDAIRREGFRAVCAEFQRIYAAEEAADAITFREENGALWIDIAYCPAVRHMRACGVTPSPVYPLTTSAVWAVICREAGFQHSMLEYHAETGAARHVIYEKRDPQ